MPIKRKVRTMKSFIFPLALAAMLAISSPAAAGDIEDVTVPLQAYLDGHATGQEQHFRRAFASDAMLFGIKDGKYSQRSANDYIAQSAGGKPPRDENLRRRWIRSIIVDGKVASAVIELDYPGMKALDHMSLVKFEDGWRIVAKVYDAYTPPKP